MLIGTDVPQGFGRALFDFRDQKIRF